MQSIKKILFSRQADSPLQKGIQTALTIEKIQKFLVEKWGAAILAQAQVLYIKNKTLTIACLNPALANEIKLIQDQLIQDANKDLPVKIIEKINFML